MSTIYRVFQQLRNLRVDDDKQRECRAMFVAQLMAYKCYLDIDGSCEALVANTTVDFKKFLSELNEYIAIDTRLAVSFYESLLKARYEVATCQIDETLMMFVLQSHTQGEHLGGEAQTTLNTLLTSREYCKTLSNVHQLLNENVAKSD